MIKPLIIGNTTGSPSLLIRSDYFTNKFIQIKFTEMANQNYRNLVFEGGGVKGIAYGGALGVLQEKGILDKIQRVGRNPAKNHS